MLNGGLLTVDGHFEEKPVGGGLDGPVGGYCSDILFVFMELCVS